ncbi:peroxidase family protein [Oceaniglobus roseus]|uniref:peroxidase family protein n=1 Tax=Oceaniglobus roseus TaxID=1737570 RepID=UPI0012FFF13D|nr:peroxidase family protein [Kandeliimicrobium roseum]
MTSSAHGLTGYDSFVRECADTPRPPLPQAFGRLGQRNPLTGLAPGGNPFTDSSVAAAFTRILDQMEDTTDDEDGEAAAGLTFFGQFVDHDVTLDATSAIGSRIDPRTIRNVRTPTLDLDCVYGSGPDATPHLYHPDHTAYLLFGTQANAYDLARNAKGTALIGDPRNDENQIVSQLQGAFVCLHNIVATALEKDATMVPAALEGIRARAILDGVTPGEKVFQAARRIVRMHYQWLVMNSLLPAFVEGGVLHKVKHALAHGTLPKPFTPDSPVMPIEFSGAAYRFGHATVRNAYHLNGTVGMVKLFEMGRDEFRARKPELNVEFARLFDLPGSAAAQKARRISRKLAGSIFHLPFITDPLMIDGHALGLADSQKLPHRNVFRDRFALELPSGQQMARAMDVPEIPAPQELRDEGITKTPLWYYCLQEAEGHGGRLGPVGGTIVATVLLRLLYLDPESIVCATHDFKPWRELGAEADGTFSLGHMLACVEAGRDSIPLREELKV